MTDNYGFGSIDGGLIADMRYEGYRDNPRGRLCGVNADLVSRRAAERGAEKAYDDYRRAG